MHACVWLEVRMQTCMHACAYVHAYCDGRMLYSLSAVILALKLSFRCLRLRCMLTENAPWRMCVRMQNSQTLVQNSQTLVLQSTRMALSSRFQMQNTQKLSEFGGVHSQLRVFQNTMKSSRKYAMRPPELTSELLLTRHGRQSSMDHL